MSKPTAKQSRGRDNLKPFKPGQSGNPLGVNGATKRRQMLEDIGRQVMAENLDTSQGKMDGWTAICRAMRNKAVKGDVHAATWLRDTFVGKPITVLANDPENPITSVGSVSEWSASMTSDKPASEGH